MRLWVMTGINVVVGLINIAGLYIWTLPSPLFLDPHNYDPKYRDAMQTAMSLGRLDAISILLSIIGVMLGLLAIFGFAYIRFRSEQIARATADAVTREMVSQWEGTRGQEDRDTAISSSTYDPKEVALESVDEEDETGET